MKTAGNVSFGGGNSGSISGLEAGLSAADCSESARLKQGSVSRNRKPKPFPDCRICSRFPITRAAAGGCRRIIQAAALIFYEQPQSLTPQKDPHPIFRDHRGADPSKKFQSVFPGAFFLRGSPARTDHVTCGKKYHILTVTLLSRESRTVLGQVSFLKHVNGGLIFVNSPILKFVNGAQKPHLRCADSLPTIRFPAVYLPFLKNQWKITWISRSVCE